MHPASGRKGYAVHKGLVSFKHFLSLSRYYVTLFSQLKALQRSLLLWLNFCKGIVTSRPAKAASISPAEITILISEGKKPLKRNTDERHFLK